MAYLSSLITHIFIPSKVKYPHQELALSTSTAVDLSPNDRRILNALFDPETLPSSVAKTREAEIIDPTLPSHPNIAPAQLAVLETQQNGIVRRVSSNSSDEAIATAISEMGQIIARWPMYSSAFVNRAMLRRMKLERIPIINSSERGIFGGGESEIASLFIDLGRAIHTSSPLPSPTTPVSPYQARTLRIAYSHRAYLYLKAAEVCGNAKDGWTLNGKGKSELEELASADFASAARYGDDVAREMSVRTNPYAKMCGAIVRNALKEERKEDSIQ